MNDEGRKQDGANNMNVEGRKKDGAGSMNVEGRKQDAGSMNDEGRKKEKADIEDKGTGELSVKQLLQAIAEFRAWQETRFPGRKPCEINGEWETWYGSWPEVNAAFCKVLLDVPPETADVHLLDEMVYIIARDNECEYLMEELSEHPKWFGVLCRHSLHMEEIDAKWQFASYLPDCECGHEIKELILALAEDQDEYVCRRALLAMPYIYPDKAAHYAERFWNRTLYAPEVQEYQRMAALTVLHMVHSPLLASYLEKAKEGGTFLRQCAEKMEEESLYF